MLNDIDYVLYSEEKIAEIVKKIGAEISEDYKDKNLLLVSVLKGSVAFMTDDNKFSKRVCKVVVPSGYRTDIRQT